MVRVGISLNGLYPDLPELITNTKKIADMCEPKDGKKFKGVFTIKIVD